MSSNNERTTNVFGYEYDTNEFDKLFEPPHKTCGLLWASISNEPGGTVRSCCIATDRIKDIDTTQKEINFGTTDPLQALQSAHSTQLRNEFRNSKWPEQCNTCAIDEKNGKESKRQIYNSYFTWRNGKDGIAWAEEDSDQVRLLDLQLIFDNTCNLKCRSCNPNYSSKWVEEANDRNLSHWEAETDIDMNDTENSAFWLNFAHWTKDLQRLEIMGGEPFYVKEFRRFVDKLIELDKAKDIVLSLSTNGTIVDKEFLEKICTNFKEVAFSVSIDGVGKQFNYLRHPAQWDEVRKNLDYFYSLQIGSFPVVVQITHTVTALNVNYLDKFHDYFCKHYPKFNVWYNLAHYPKWLTCSVLPANAKAQITEKLQNHNFTNRVEIDAIINYMNTPLYSNGNSLDGFSSREGLGNEKLIAVDNISIDEEWELFQEQIVSGDHYRHENFRDTFPELWKMVENSFDYGSILNTVQQNGYPKPKPFYRESMQ